MFFVDEAPIIVDQTDADLTDVYAYVDDDSPSSTDEVTSQAVLLGVLDGATDDTTGTLSIDTETSDVFVFLSGAPGKSESGTGPANPTPAPEEEEPEPPVGSIEYEMKYLNSARHTATRGVLNSLLD